MTIDDVIVKFKERLKEAEYEYSVYYTFKNMYMIQICQTKIELYKDFLEHLEVLKENK